MGNSKIFLIFSHNFRKFNNSKDCDQTFLKLIFLYYPCETHLSLICDLCETHLLPVSKSCFTRWYVYDRFNYLYIGGWYKIVWRKALQRDTVPCRMMSYALKLWTKELWSSFPVDREFFIQFSVERSAYLWPCWKWMK